MTVMTRARVLGAVAAAVAAGALVVGGSASAGTWGVAGADVAACFAHVVNPGHAYYLPGCSGHDEPELDPVSSAPHSARDLTWRVALPANGTRPVPDVGPTFWFGGAVADSNPEKLGAEGFLELQIYPDSLVSACTSDGDFIVTHAVGTYTACSPVWSLVQEGDQIEEPAAFNGMLTDASGTGPFVMRARDVVDIHIWAPSMHEAYREQIADETTGETSSVLVLNSDTDGPLTPQFDRNKMGNALDWGIVWDTPMSFVYEIGHANIYGPHNGDFCLPGQTFCHSFNAANWAGIQPLRIFDVTFGDGSHPEHWAAVSDTGGRAEVDGKSWVGPTDCTHYGGPFCIYPWFSWDGAAFNFGVDYPNTVDNFGRIHQFARQPHCPEDGVFPGATYCDRILR
jgi:hypothetical protein